MEHKAGIPVLSSGEILWVAHYDRCGYLQYIITSKPARGSYSLFELVNEKFVRWGRGQDPQELADRYEKALCIPASEPEAGGDEELEFWEDMGIYPKPLSGIDVPRQGGGWEQ